MRIIESQTEISHFLEMWNNNPSLIVPVSVDLELHSLNNSLSFLYVRQEGETFIVPFNHVDCKSIQIDLSQSTQPKWVWDKKSILHYNLDIQNLRDIQTYSFFTTNSLLEFKPEEQPFISHYTRLGIREKLGKISPIMKWAEYLNSLFTTFPINENMGNNWVDDTMIPLLSQIERYGVGVDREKFIDRFPHAIKHLKGNSIYTQYNPYTITSRPSNRHGGINYSALNKGDGTREVFVPKSGHIFLQMDYDGYHPRIIGKLIGYDLPKTSVHQWLADQYGCSYDEGKGITFQLLYGGIPEEFEEIPYYKGVKEFIQRLWEKSSTDGYLQTKHRRIPLEWIEGNNPQKLFNYLLQATETELNMERLKQILEFIGQTKIELPLYTYDSFLFSYPMDSDTTQAKRLKEIVEGSGFPIKASWGTDYSKL